MASDFFFSTEPVTSREKKVLAILSEGRGSESSAAERSVRHQYHQPKKSRVTKFEQLFSLFLLMYDTTIIEVFEENA